MEEINELLKRLNIINRDIDDYLFVFEYRKCAEILEKVLEIPLLGGVSIGTLINRGLRLRELLRSGLLDSDYEYFALGSLKVLYTAVAPILYKLEEVRNFVQWELMDKELISRIDACKSYIRLEDEDAEAIMVLLEREENTVFEIRTLLRTHTLLIESEEEYISELRKTLIRLFEETSQGKINIELAPKQGANIKIWFTDLYADMVFLGRRIHAIIFANNIPYTQLKIRVKNIVKNMLKVFSGAGLLTRVR